MSNFDGWLLHLFVGGLMYGLVIFGAMKMRLVHKVLLWLAATLFWPFVGYIFYRFLRGLGKFLKELKVDLGRDWRKK